ncbi:unnamed protein product [Schistocephalus solidus]|uniref:Uncharacterized protein n=1 Tax=Schistocephalus solidus TaxID=70667 RepID=A0A183SJH4_SCHSO|nr:unnamed protein product [Schistocephalus solidus]
MLLWPPLTGTKLSPVAPRSWVLPSGHTPGNHHDRWDKPGEGLRCCVCLHIRRPSLIDHKLRGRKTQTKNNTHRPHPPRHTLRAARGQLEELGAGFIFFWSSRPKAERRDAGVAFAIRNDIVGRLPCMLQGINDSLMSLRLPLRGDQFATIISA